MPNYVSKDTTPRLPRSATVGSALHEAEQSLESAGVEGARLEATLLLGHVLGYSRAQLLAALLDPLAEDQVSRFFELTTRRANREPLQYLRGLSLIHI